MNTITDAELNRRLAEGMGWVGPSSDDRGDYYVDATGKQFTPRFLGGFSPATSSDHLREYVLPEIYKRNLASEFEVMLSRATGPDDWLFILPPRVLALAALKALEAKP